MSSIDDVQLDADGYVDMDQFPDDGTDLAAGELADLRATLLADPVEEPSDAAWDAMFDDVVAAGDDGPFDLADVTFEAVADDGTGPDAVATDDPVDDTDTDTDDAVDDTVEDIDDIDDIDLADTDIDADLDIDLDLDAGVDLTPPDVDDGGYDVDGIDVETPADISHDFEDTL